MSVGHQVQRWTKALWLWSGFVVCVCAVALANLAFWHLHPVLSQLSGMNWLPEGYVTANAIGVSMLLFLGVVVFAVAGLVDASTPSRANVSRDK